MATSGSKAVLLIAWILSLAGVLAISVSFSGESTRFVGIADDQEQIIRFTSPVEIVRYGFVSGQEVKPDDLIVEVRQADLETRMQLVEEQIHGLTFGNRESRASMEAEIVQLQADLAGTTAELDSEIRNLRARQQVQDNLLVGMENGGAKQHVSPIQQEIEGLQTRKWALRRAANSRIDDLKSRLATSERPVDSRISELEKQRADLERQRDDLTVLARVAGRVGSVLFKVGDTVPPYQPVLTIHGSNPTFVNGFIHESVLNGVQIGQTVWIRSSNSMHSNAWHEGIVESLGSRIVEFPDRLKVNQLTQAWGREVVIHLSGEHELLLGEKVDVQLERPLSTMSGIRMILARLGA